jgi:hypothetical protein
VTKKEFTNSIIQKPFVLEPYKGIFNYYLHLEGCNAISYTMTLEQMLESIGDPVKNWRRK